MAEDESSEESEDYIAAVSIRTTVDIESEPEGVMRRLGLKQKHGCIVLEDRPDNRGSLEKIKDFITWGEVDEEVIEELVSERGNGEDATEQFFRLQPPKGGYEGKGIKVPYSRGGALGYRGDGMNDLLRRML